jgi:hypothetical protein
MLGQGGGSVPLEGLGVGPDAESLHLGEDGEHLQPELLLAQGRGRTTPTPVDVVAAVDYGGPASPLLESAEFDQAVEELEVGLHALALHLREQEVGQLRSLLLSLLLLAARLLATATHDTPTTRHTTRR